MSIRTTAEALWSLLDAIDTTDDSAGDNDKAFRVEVMRIANLRHRYGTSDGYTLDLTRDGPFFCDFCHRIKEPGEIHQADDYCLFPNP